LENLHLELKEVDLAISCFMQASKINPESALAQLGLGRSYMATENKKFSAQAYENALELSSDNNGAGISTDMAPHALTDIGIFSIF
jgi:cytochrome c-type biogenesis protein CcmH/NrfG